MYKFMRKNQRKMLAIFAAGLMVVFILPTTFKGNSGRGGRGDTVIGRVNAYDADLTSSELQAAREDLDILRTLRGRSIYGMPGMPAIFLLASQEEVQQMMFAMRFGMGQPQTPAVIQELTQHPEMFALLQREAVLSGIAVSPERLETTVNEILAIPPNTDAQTLAEYRRAVNSLLLVQGAFNRAAGNIHVSEPLKRITMAQFAQNLTLDLVEFNAKDFAAKVPAPTTQQLSYQFERFSNKTPQANDTKENAFGFGYRYPNRIKLQYIAVNRDAVRASIKPDKLTDDQTYAWRVRARKYYAANQHLFTTTQPTTAPKPSGSGFDLSATTAPSTGPSVKPFAEVEKEIIDRLVRDETDKKAEAIQNKITSRLAGDWLAYQQATNAAGGATTNPTTRPATAPMTSYGVPFNSYAYLQALAADIQKQDGVLLIVTQMADDFQSQQQLTELPGIGKSHFDRFPFADYAIEFAEPFVPPQAKTSPMVLNFFKPSRVLRDDLDNTYVFRIVGAEGAHAPLDRSEVAAKVETDCKNAAAFEQAKVAAQAMLDDAKKSGNANLKTSADAAKKSVISAGPFRGLNTYEIPNFKIEDTASRAVFLAEAVELLKHATNDSPHPLGIIELPREGKVLVAQLAKVEPTWQKDSQFADQIQITDRIRGELEHSLAGDWYHYDNVIARLRYVPKDRGDGTGAPAPTTPNPNTPPEPQPRL